MRLEQELNSTINIDIQGVPNLNLNVVSRSPPKSSRLKSSNRNEEDIVSNRSAFSVAGDKGDISHRSNSLKPRFEKKNKLPPQPPSQNISEDYSRIFDELMDEISKNQVKIEIPIGVSMEKSYGS